MYGAHTESFDNASSQPNYEAIMSAENKNGLAAFTHYTHTLTHSGLLNTSTHLGFL